MAKRNRTTPVQLHRIGKELADKVLEGKYSYVVTTHIDKGHIHNHIIFCAADNIEYNKYHDCTHTYHRIRHLSDELCKEHNLSVIIPGGERGKKYKEWQSDQNGSTWKTQLRRDINLYGGARRVLEQAGIKLKGLNVDKLRDEYQALETQKKELTATYKSCEIEVRNLKRKQENLNQYLGRTQTDPVQEQQTKNKNHSL